MTDMQRIIPVFSCENMQVEHDFLVKVFDFQPGYITQDEQQQAYHGEVYAGDITIWFHRAMASNQERSPQAWNSELVVYVADVNTHYARVCAAGATIESELEDQPYGQREYGVRDPEGHVWWFATDVVPRPSSID